MIPPGLRSLAFALLCCAAVVGQREAPATRQQPAHVDDAATAELAAIVADGSHDDERRCAALATLQDRGDLDVDTMLAALGAECDALRATAVAILRHEWPEWPRALQNGLDRFPLARTAVLRELAVAPRPSVDEWVRRQTIGIMPGDRMLALAARRDPPDRDEAEIILAALAHGGEAADQAMARVPPAVADRLVAVAHQRLEGGAPIENFGPFLARLSPIGSRQVMGLATSLPPETAEALCEFLVQRDDPQFWERVRAAVDGEIPLEPMWLLRAGRLLTTDARRQRVAAVLADAQQPEQVRVRAFDALLEGGVWVPELQDFAAAGGSDRWRRLLRRGLDGVPVPLWQAALNGDPDVQVEALAALGRQPMTAVLEARVIDLVLALQQQVAAADRPRDARFSVGLSALAQSGGDEGVAVALRLARGDRDAMLQVCDQLSRRRDPIATAALLAELQRPAAGDPRLGDPRLAAEVRDRLLLALAEAGDRRQRRALIAAVPRRPAVFARRCRHALPLEDDDCRELLAALPAIEDHDVRVEVLLWIGGSPLPAARTALRDRWAEAEAEEEREVALQGLLRSPDRATLLAEWRATAGFDAGRDDLFAFAALATMPEQLGSDDVELMQFLLFEQPRRDPRERERATRFADGRTGFPVVAAIADRIRREPDRASRIVAPASELAAAHDVEGLVRQRYLFLWTALQAIPELRVEVGRATAALVLGIPDPGDAGAGPAHYYLAMDLEQRGHHADAAVAFRAALARMVRLPADAMHARIHLGVRDPESGIDPYAALAAAPWLATARAALAGGDRDGARGAATLALEFAGRDRATANAASAIVEDLK